MISSESSSELSLDVERGRKERRASPLPPPLPPLSTLGLPSLSASLFDFSQIQFARFYFLIIFSEKIFSIFSLVLDFAGFGHVFPQEVSFTGSLSPC